MLSGIITAVFARRIISWITDYHKRAYPWLSKYTPYDEHNEWPRIAWPTESGRLETQVLRVCGTVFDVASLVSIIYLVSIWDRYIYSQHDHIILLTLLWLDAKLQRLAGHRQGVHRAAPRRHRPLLLQRPVLRSRADQRFHPAAQD